MTTDPFRQILVVGGTGQTGHRVLQEILSSSYFDKDLKLGATSRSVTEESLPSGPLAFTVGAFSKNNKSKINWFSLDLEGSTADVLVELKKIGGFFDDNQKLLLIFSAAFTNVELCESDAAFCVRVNEENTIQVLNWAEKNFKAKSVFYSTDYVFDGLTGPNSEFDVKNPLSQYGKSKSAVEDWILKNSPQSLILRTTGVFDYLPGSKNFLMQMLELWKNKKKTLIPSDQYANPTWAGDLARATFLLTQKKAFGIYHVGGGTYLSRIEFAYKIAKHFDVTDKFISGVLTSDLNQKAKRPLNGGLRIDRLTNELGWGPMSVDLALKFLKKLSN